jgi:hypothetical protein
MFVVKLPITQHNIPADPNSQHYCFGNLKYRVRLPFSMIFVSSAFRCNVLISLSLYIHNLLGINGQVAPTALLDAVVVETK